MKVIIRKCLLKEVSSEEQKRYMCAMKDKSADERPEGLSKAEADEMCKAEIKEIQTSGIDRQAVVDNLEEIGFTNVKFLGEGQIGAVFSVRTPDYKEAAVKALKKGPNQTKREIENYLGVEKARQKSNNIKKHFPKVYEVINDKSPDFAYIVMERLTDGPAAKWASELFAGFEAAPQVKPHEFLKDRDPKRSISKRIETMLIQELPGKDGSEVRRDGGLGEGFMSQIGPSHLSMDETNALLQRAQGLRNWLSSKKMNDDLADKVMGELYGSGDRFLEVLAGDLKDSPGVFNFFAAFVGMIIDFYDKKQQKQKEEIEKLENPRHKYMKSRQLEFNRDDFLKSIGIAGDSMVDWYRKNSPIPVQYDPTGRARAYKGASSEIAKRIPGAKSIMEAIEELYSVFGIWPKDMHIGNVMQRENGDIVIVDLGLFSKNEPTAPRGPSMDSEAPTMTMTESKIRKIKVLLRKG